jgi:hypothetical protein
MTIPKRYKKCCDRVCCLLNCANRDAGGCHCVCWIKDHIWFLEHEGEELNAEKIAELKEKLKTYEIEEMKTYSMEIGSDVGIRFLTSEGIKHIEPGKRYDQNLNEIKDSIKKTDGN